MSELRIVINGAGAAGIRIAEMLKAAGAVNVVLCDSRGVINTRRTGLTTKKQEHVADTQAETLDDAMRDAHVFVGVSVADVLKPAAVESMASYPAIFAMANPDPEIRPEVVQELLKNQPYVMATGRSDYPNQVNNVLGFPFLFRGALDVAATAINMEMKIAGAEALAAVAREPVAQHVLDLFEDEPGLQFSDHYIIPKPFDRRLFVEVPFAVAQAAARSGVGDAARVETYRQELEDRNEARIDVAATD